MTNFWCRFFGCDFTSYETHVVEIVPDRAQRRVGMEWRRTIMTAKCVRCGAQSPDGVKDSGLASFRRLHKVTTTPDGLRPDVKARA